MSHTKTNLKSMYFRARLVENNKPVFVWDFGQFSKFNDFYQTIKHCERKDSIARIDYYLCHACDTKEVLLDSFHVDLNSVELINYDHPRRVEKSGATCVGFDRPVED